MYKRHAILISLAVFTISPTFPQKSIDLEKYKTDLSSSLQHFNISGRQMGKENQNIHILRVPLSNIGKELTLDIAWSDSSLIKTSDFSSEAEALAGINAGFFNVREGGSVTYLEDGNERVARRSWRGDGREGSGTNLNGAVMVMRDGLRLPSATGIGTGPRAESRGGMRGSKIRIEESKTNREYLNSHLEDWVLVTGPVLLLDGKKAELREGSFVEARHPRTVIGTNNEYLFLITVDGRNRKAVGMALPELQDFLLSLECLDAINLDGGGSTTMWIGDQLNTVVNCPSDNRKFDNQGERKVANAILLLKNF